MARRSSIEWTEATWNPVTGCSKISTGCRFCYAERMARRLQAMGVKQYQDGFDVRLAPHALHQPYSWKAAKVVFVNSMSDLFHEDVPLEYIKQVFQVMNDTPRHTYQILTKRSGRLKELAQYVEWTPNIWMGVSVEDSSLTFRIIDLASTSARVKFLSCEPLLAPLGCLDLGLIDWVIVGGESGPGARPMKEDWVRSIYQQCQQQRVKFFFKQWGHQSFNADATDPTIAAGHPHHAKGGCQLDGRVIREMPCLATSAM